MKISTCVYGKFTANRECISRCPVRLFAPYFSYQSTITWSELLQVQSPIFCWKNICALHPLIGSLLPDMNTLIFAPRSKLLRRLFLYDYSFQVWVHIIYAMCQTCRFATITSQIQNENFFLWQAINRPLRFLLSNLNNPVCILQIYEHISCELRQICFIVHVPVNGSNSNICLSNNWCYLKHIFFHLHDKNPA